LQFLLIRVGTQHRKRFRVITNVGHLEAEKPGMAKGTEPKLDAF